MSSDDAFAPTAAAIVTAADTVTSAPRDSHITLEIGKLLGERYEVRGYLGEGGMGAVYRVFDTVLEEEVALKVVRGAFAHEAHLRDEVKIAQKVTHENVCRIYDLEDIAGYHVLKMEYVPGETLAARIAERGKLAIDEALRIARGIAAGLQAAHARGIVHRDLKPGNVMLADERVVLMDFGLARQITDEDVDRSGTPGYMSPEQLAGGRIDERSDLYALGCILYEMLAGERAFARGSMTEVASRQRDEPTPDVRVKRANAPRWLVRATRRLMAKDPAERAGGLALLARTRMPRWLGAAIAGLVAIAVAVNVLVLMREDAKLVGSVAKWQWTPRLEPLVIGGKPSNKDRPTFSPSGAWLGFVHDLSAGGGELDLVKVKFPDGGVPERLLNEPPEDAVGNPRWLRDNSGLLLWVDSQPGGMMHVVRSGLKTTAEDGHDEEDCSSGRGGSRVAVVNPEHGPRAELSRREDPGDALVYYRNGRPPETLIPAAPSQSLDHPRCDRDGTRVVFTKRGEGIWWVELADDYRAHQLTNNTSDVTPAFTHEGTVVFSRAGQLYEIALVDGAQPRRLTNDDRVYVTPEPHPTDPDLLVVAAPQPPRLGIMLHDRVIDSTVTKDRHVIDLEDRQPQSLVLAPNAIIAVNGPNVELVAFDGRVRVLAAGRAPFLSLDKQRVFFAGADPRELWVAPLAGGKPEKVATVDGKILYGAEGPDGVHVSWADVDLGISSYLLVAGQPPVREPWRRVIPAPAGRLRAILDGSDLVTFADGARALDRNKEYIVCATSQTPVWLDAKRIACASPGTRQLQIKTMGIEGMPFEIRDPSAKEMIVADAQRWLVVRNLEVVDFYTITNFAGRLR